MSAEAAPETKPFTTTDSVDPKVTSDDPFAAQRSGSDDPFAKEKLDGVSGGDDMAPPADGATAESKGDDIGRRMSREWDASKVPPSQFQKRKGSIYATPSSRDSQLKSKDQHPGYFEKLKEKGWDKISGKTK